MIGGRLDVRRHASALQHTVLALVTFVPLLLTAPHRIAADTRQELYVDPGAFLSRALTLWDPHVHLGSVAHSNIGNVFPMGSFFAATDLVGIPAWIAQRLWIGLLLFVAGAGVLYLARTISWRSPGVVIAALAYALTPYTLQYAPRTSVLLLPYAALPWLVGLTERAVRTGSWRHPAILAIAVMTISGANVSPTILVMLGPALWLAFAIGSHETSWRQAFVVLGRTALLTVGTCALWIAALLVEARYGLNLLAYTETLPQVSTTSSAAEALRGLGYWLFYGTEARLPNISAATSYLESTGIVLISFLVPGLALVSAFAVRWRYRAFCIALVVTGVVISVGAYPYNDPSIVGRGFKGLADLSSAALALRSSTRAVPLVVLGLALLLGAGVGALIERRAAWGLTAGVLAGVLVLANAPALFTGDFVDPNFSRPDSVPAYWREVARALDRAGGDTRVLEIPGNQFAVYRWGTTYETSLLPTLLDRPSVAREQIPFGSPAAADLLSALDRRMQEGVFEPDALAPLARLLSAGAVVLRSDLEYERYLAPRPRALWALLVPTAPGLGDPQAFGAPTENRPDPRIPLLDAQTLGLPADTEDPPPVAVFPVEDAPAIVHALTARRPTLVDGDGEGLVDAASAGLVTGDRLILYGPWLASRPDERDGALDAGADVVVTDTNRRRERRWRSTRATTGLTDRTGHRQPDTGQGEANLDVFPDTSDATRSVVEQRGATVDATLYGSPLTFDTDQRAANALDGDPATAWEIGTITDPVGEELVIRSAEPLTTDHIDLLQAQGGYRTRTISEVVLRFDGGDPERVRLDDSSHTAPGQRVTFTRRTFSTLELEITATQETPDVVARGGSPSGFAEVSIPGLEFEELVRLPLDLTRALDGASDGHRLVYVMTRLRSNPAERGDEEQSLARVFSVPDGRAFLLNGDARLSASAPDTTIDSVLGLPGVDGGGVTVTSSGRLPGALDQRARAATDGDRSTHWTGTFFDQAGAWVEVATPESRTVDHLDLAVVADGRHSVPTQVEISAGGDRRVVDLPPIADRPEPDAVVDVPVDFAPLTGTTFRVTVTAVREITSADAFSGRPLPQPVAIAELGLPGVRAPAPPIDLPGACRDDLLTVDDVPVPIRVVGTTADAVARRALHVEPCGGPLTLAAGEHELRATPGRDLGIDLDRLVLGSERGGGPLEITAAGTPAPPPAAAAPPTIRVLESGAASMRVRVQASNAASWLVLAQSQSEGWHAEIEDDASLGESSLVNGYANGWRLPASSRARTVVLTWRPQRTLNLAFVIATLAVLACLGLVWRSRRWQASTSPAPGPALELPVDAGPRPTDRRVLIGLPVGAAIAGLVVVDVVAAVIVGALVAIALTVRRGRIVLAIAALALVAAGLLSIVVTQAREDRAVGFGWTDGQETEHRAVLAGLLVLAADPLVARARARARQRQRRLRRPLSQEPEAREGDQ